MRAARHDTSAARCRIRAARKRCASPQAWIPELSSTACRARWQQLMVPQWSTHRPLVCYRAQHVRSPHAHHRKSEKATSRSIRRQVLHRAGFPRLPSDLQCSAISNAPEIRATVPIWSSSRD